MIDSSIIIPEGYFIGILIFGFGYLLSRKHSIQAIVEYVIFQDKQLFNKEVYLTKLKKEGIGKK